jgi:hypothetical protein
MGNCSWQLSAASCDLLSVCQQLQPASFRYGLSNIVYNDFTTLISGHTTLRNLIKVASALGKKEH